MHLRNFYVIVPPLVSLFPGATFVSFEYFKSSVNNIQGLFFFCFTSSRDWSRNLAPFSQLIIFKTETNRELVTLVFPHFRQFARFYFELSLAALDISLLSDWLF